MKVSSISLLLLPLWLASCTSSLDLVGEHSLEHDEFYLSGGERHLADDALEAERQAQLLDQYAEYSEDQYDQNGSGYMGNGRSQSQLWNRGTAGFGTGFGYSPGLNYGFGTPYGFGAGYSPFASPFSGYGNTYGHSNLAFTTGYDAWGNPIGGFGNPYGPPYGQGFGYGNGWGTDPWGGGHWGAPGFGYGSGYGYGYNPYYGSFGAYPSPWGWGESPFITNGNGVANGPSTAPRPRPSFGQFTGTGSENSESGSGSNVGEPNNGSGKVQPNLGSSNPNRGRRNVISLPVSEPNRGRHEDHGRQSPDRSGETRPNRPHRNNDRPNWSSPSRNSTSPSAPRGGGSYSRPSSPRPSAPRSSGGRSGRGGQR